MQPEIRRIVAADAHRRKTGRCPRLIHSLGTGESFVIEPTSDGFIDLASGLQVRCEAGAVALCESNLAINIALTDDIAFSGFDPNSGEHFHGRAGGGATVTIYDARMVDYFQYALA
jgi:hypothetical protein